TPQINVWQQMLERATRQWFEERSATVRVDGNGSDTLFFSVPIISVNELYINDGDTVLDTEFYEVYNNRTDYPDDRRNPRIKLRPGRGSSIFTRGVSARPVFAKG